MVSTVSATLVPHFHPHVLSLCIRPILTFLCSHSHIFLGKASSCTLYFTTLLDSRMHILVCGGQTYNRLPVMSAGEASPLKDEKPKITLSLLFGDKSKRYISQAFGNLGLTSLTGIRHDPDLTQPSSLGLGLIRHSRRCSLFTIVEVPVPTGGEDAEYLHAT